MSKDMENNNEDEQPVYEITHTEEVNSKMLSTLMNYFDNQGGPPIPVADEVKPDDDEEQDWGDD